VEGLLHRTRSRNSRRIREALRRGDHLPSYDVSLLILGLISVVFRTSLGPVYWEHERSDSYC